MTLRAGPNALPLHPRITPGLAIAGVILMAAGTAYALIGIKNKWWAFLLESLLQGSLADDARRLHVPLSAAFLTGLAVIVWIPHRICGTGR